MIQKIQLHEVQENNNIISVHYSTSDVSVSLLKECYRILSDIPHKYGVTYQGEYAKKNIGE